MHFIEITYIFIVSIPLKSVVTLSSVIVRSLRPNPSYYPVRKRPLTSNDLLIMMTNDQKVTETREVPTSYSSENNGMFPFDTLEKRVNEILMKATGQGLTDLQIKILKGIFQGQTYSIIAEKNDYSEQHIKNNAGELFQSLHKSGLLIEEVSKKNLISVIKRYDDKLENDNNHHAPASESKQTSKKVPFSMIGKVDETEVQLLQEIVKSLRQRGNDITISISDFKKGSLQIILNGSQEGLQKIENLFKAGELNEILGIPVENVELTKDNHLAFTIAGQVNDDDIAYLKSALVGQNLDKTKQEKIEEDSTTNTNKTAQLKKNQLLNDEEQLIGASQSRTAHKKSIAIDDANNKRNFPSTSQESLLNPRIRQLLDSQVTVFLDFAIKRAFEEISKNFLTTKKNDVIPYLIPAFEMFCNETNLTQKQIAKKLGISESKISKYIKGSFERLFIEVKKKVTNICLDFVIHEIHENNLFDNPEKRLLFDYLTENYLPSEVFTLEQEKLKNSRTRQFKGLYFKRLHHYLKQLQSTSSSEEPKSG